MAAHPYGERVATRLARLPRALRPPAALRAPAPRLPPDPHAGGPAGRPSPAISQAAAMSPDDGPRSRRRLYGRLAAVFVAGSGVLALVTLPLPAPGSDPAVMAAVSTAAVVLGIAAWLMPWERWPRWVSLCLAPPAFALIALGNTFGGADLHTYAVFFIVAFVWIGMAHPPRTSTALAPLAVAAYILPLPSLPGSFGTGAASAAVAIPICVLVGEGIAWGMSRLDQIELAWQRERDRADHLRELDEMKDAFLSAVSHELRTPITVCRGHLEVLEEGAGEQERRAVREMLVDELGLMGRLVDDLATLARIDDRALLRLESLTADDFLHGLSAKAETILPERLRVEPGTSGATFRADPQRLTQALLNLVRNAAEHARGDGPVHLRATAGPLSWLFEVADEGGGLAPGDEEIVFEPFVTGSSPTGSSTTGGTGLGLAIVRGIANAHGGESGVMNRPGRGATFWIRIPR